MNKVVEQVLDKKELELTLNQLASQVAQQEKEKGHFRLVGIHTRGVYLTKRLAAILGRPDEAIGILDINLYRDDLSQAHQMPLIKETKIPFSIEGAPILLVDDVLYTGRTIRAAMDALIDLGRPKLINLLVLVDRGGRELPIQADFCGQSLKVKKGENVQVNLVEVDSSDGVKLLQGGEND